LILENGLILDGLETRIVCNAQHPQMHQGYPGTKPCQNDDQFYDRVVEQIEHAFKHRWLMWYKTEGARTIVTYNKHQGASFLGKDTRLCAVAKHFVFSSDQTVEVFSL